MYRKTHKSVYTITLNASFVFKHNYKDQSFKQVLNFATLKKIYMQDSLFEQKIHNLQQI
jgi:hypothetical protein